MHKSVDEETKGAALADLMTGISVSEVARKYGVSRTAVQNWRNQAGIAPALQPEQQAKVAGALDRYIVAALDILTEQIRNSGKTDWLATHGVSGFVDLHRTLAEGVARVVEAQEVAASESEPEPTPIRRAS